MGAYHRVSDQVVTAAMTIREAAVHLEARRDFQEDHHLAVAEDQAVPEVRVVDPVLQVARVDPEALGDHHRDMILPVLCLTL